MAISMEELPDSRLAARKVGIVLKSCEWNNSDQHTDDTVQLVDSVVAPPASTVTLTQTSVRVTFCMLGALVIAGCLVATLLSLSPVGQNGRVPAQSCCCTQAGRSIADCGSSCSCSKSCKELCQPSPTWDPQCHLPYITRNDIFRNVDDLTDQSSPYFSFQGHADAPLVSADDFKLLCPTSPESAAYSTNVDKFYDTTGVGGERWYRFIGAGGDALPLHPPPEYHCGTANGGWLSGYNRTNQNGTTIDTTSGTTINSSSWGAVQARGRRAPAHRRPVSACAKSSDLYANCSRCMPGSPIDGGMETVGGLCRAHCNAFGLGGVGWCGTGDSYGKGGIDCTPCRNWVPGAESEFSDGPPVDYAEPGRYPTATEGKVAMTVCFSAGKACPNQQNVACGLSTCWRHQAILALRCDGFFLWKLSYVPYCRAGFCTINTLNNSGDTPLE